MKAIIAFTVSPLVVAALVPMAIEGRVVFYPFVMFAMSALAVYVFTLVIAVPVYLAIPLTYRHRLLPLSLAAFTVAALTFLVLNLPSASSFSQVGQTVLVQDGSLTLEGWMSLLQQSLCVGLAGAVGALIFWLVIRSCNMQKGSK